MFVEYHSNSIVPTMKLFLVCLLVAAIAAVAYGEVESSKAAACNFGQCNLMCMTNGYRGGYCLGNTCVCQGRRSLSDAENLPIPNAACNFGQCNLMCMTNGYRGGYCLGNTCVCQGRRSLSDAENLDIPRAACDPGQCYRRCIFGGYSGGSCINNACICRIYRSIEDVENQQNTIETPVNKMAACEGQNCVLYCQRMGKNGGACVGGRCWCF